MNKITSDIHTSVVRETEHETAHLYITVYRTKMFIWQ